MRRYSVTVSIAISAAEKLERGLDANIQAGLAIPDSIRDLVKSSAVKRLS